MKYLLSLVSLFISVSLLSTSKKSLYDYAIPKNIEDCFVLLDKTMDSDKKELIKTLPEDSLSTHEGLDISQMELYYAWIATATEDESKLVKYFQKKGFHKYNTIYKTILLSYHRYLNHQKIDLKGLLEKYQRIKKEEKEEQRRLIKEIEDNNIYKADTINCVYIPLDLADCCVQLDQLLAEEDKEFIKNLPDRESTIQLHMSLGLWIRNNWGLWGGSRLQNYFFDMGLDHPDGMSSIILEFYYDWLNKK